MRALTLGRQGLKFDNAYPDPKPAPGEVLVQVLRAGICETDLQLIAGYMQFEGVLGHEFVGTAVSGRFRGQRVVGEINCHCAACETCRAGRARHCPHRSVIGILNHDGAFAEYVAVPEKNLHPVPENVSTDHAVFVEPLAAAFEIPEQIELAPGHRVYVLGDGRLGNLCAQVIRQFGCRLTVFGKHASKLSLLSDMGIDTALVSEVHPQRDGDIVVDCTGSPSGLEAAISHVRPRGTIVLKTTVAGQQAISLAPIVIDELTLVGSRCGPFDRALAALEAGTIDVEPLISATYPLDDAIAAFERARSGQVLKLLLKS